LQDERNRQLGIAGEELVLLHEKARLMAAGMGELADEVVHVSVMEGDSAGYDIRSFELDGSPRFIEVKTTRGEANTSFYLSANEVAFSTVNHGSYFLYRLYEYDASKKSSKMFLLSGSMTEVLQLTAITFRAEISQQT
jgi:hypothetical protein